MAGNPKKSEITILLTVCAIAMVPMALVIIKQRGNSNPGANLGSSPAPVLSVPTPTGPTSRPRITAQPAPVPVLSQAYTPLPPVLSPNGLYAATTQQTTPFISTNSNSSTKVYLNRVLLIFRVSDGKMLAQHWVYPGVTHLRWSADSKSVAAWDDESGQAWKGILSSPHTKPEAGRFFYAEESFNRVGMEVDLEADVALQVLMGGEFRAHKVSTDEVIPLVQNTGGGSDALKAVLAPASLQAGGKKLLVVKSDVLVKVDPTQTPTPRPTAIPTPLTPEQKKFSEREAVISEELSKIIERLQGEEEVPDAEAQKLEARAKEINQEIREGRDRLFPTPVPVPTPLPTRGPKDYFRVSLRDYRSGQLLWERKVTSMAQRPVPLFTPDGKSLLLLGQALPQGTDGDKQSIEVLDSITGKTRLKLDVGDNGLDDSDDMQFFSTGHTMFAYSVWKDGDYRLHIVDLSNGKEQAQWSLKALKRLGIGSFEGFSVDGSGQKWAFSTDSKLHNGWKVFTRAQLNVRAS